MRNIPFHWTTLYTDSDTSDLFVPVTGWLPASDLKDVRVLFYLTALMGNFKCRPAFQTANSTDDSPTTSTFVSSTYESSATTSFPTAWKDVAPNVADKQLIRFGFECRLTEGGPPAMATVSGQVQALLNS